MRPFEFWSADDRGATAIDYVFVASLVAVAIAATLATVGGSLGALFGRVAASFPA
jgi:Flp pilus assembly pilin Flp